MLASRRAQIIGTKITVLFGLWCTFSLATHAQKPELVVQTGHSEGVQSLAFSRNSKLLATQDLAGVVKVWDVDTGDELRTFATECSGSLPQEHHIQFGDNLLGVSESCKHNGRAAERNDDHIVVYDVAAEKKVGRYPGNKVFAFSPDNKLVATCYERMTHL